jgi:hypothetical protein
MKYLPIFCLTLLMMACSSLLAQRIENPANSKEVKQAFKKVHPGAFPYEWKYVKKKNAYKAYFVNDGKKFKSYFRPNGEWMYAKTKVEKEDLPENIWKQYYESEWMDWKLSKTQLRLTPDCGTIYILKVKRGKKSTKETAKLYYDENGKFLKVKSN